jgi:8-oxo-dGTP pyrophosphatase MutT (NUDIX family)
VMERGTEPLKGCWVLPGGIVEPGETVEPAPPWLSIVGLSAYDAQGPTN